MSNFSCRCLIDGLLTNQIALLLPVRGRTEFDKMFGIKGRRFLSSPPPPPSYSPPPYFSPIFWLTPGALLRSPAFRSLVRSPRHLKKEKNRLLRRLDTLSRPSLFHRGHVRRVYQLCKKTCFRKGSIPTRDAVLSFSPGPLTSREKRLVSIKDLVVSLCSFKGVDERWYMFEALFIGVRVPLNKSLRT